MPGDNHWHTRMDVVPVNWGPMKEGEPIKDAFKDYAKYTFTKKYVENDNRPKFSWTLFIHVTIFSSKDPKCKKFCAKEKGDDVLIVMSMKWGSTTPTPDLGIGY